VVIARFADSSDVVVKVNLLSMMMPSKLITDETATDTVLMLDAAFNCGDHPTSITSDLSAFGNSHCRQTSV